MGLSFEESLKKMKKENEVAMLAANPAVASLNINDSIMTLEEPMYDGLAYSGDDWTRDEKHDYRWFEAFVDEKYSFVDEKKSINLNEEQRNITQETNSQFIPFEMPRFYDGIDLTEFTLSVHFTRSDKQHGTSIPVNVVYNSEKIRFAWLVDGDVTGVPGDVHFEVHATGSILDSKNNAYPYEWKAISDKPLNILQSLCGLDCGGIININDSWVKTLVEDVASTVAKQIAQADIGAQVTKAENAADRAETAANSAEDKINNALEGYATEQYVQTEISNINIDNKLTEYAKISDLDSYALKTEIPVVPTNVSEFINDAGYLTEHQSLEGYATEKFVTDQIDAADISEKLYDYVTTVALDEKLGNLADSEGNKLTVEDYVKQEVDAVDVSSQLTEYAKSADVYNKSETYSKDEVDDAIKNVSVDLTGYATEKFVTDITDPLSSSVSTNTNSITSLNKSVEEINSTLESIDTSPRVTYRATYGNVESKDGTTQEYMFSLLETEGDNDPVVVSRFQIMGGSGGTTSSVTLSIAYMEGYTTPLVVTSDEKAIVKYIFSGEDSAGDTSLDGTASWKVGNRIVATEEVATGECEFDLSDYVTVGDNKILLTITHATGAIATKSWTVKVVDVRLESTFDDTKANTVNEPVSFTFTPYGGVNKTIHFLLDGEEIDTKTSSAAAAGLSDSYIIPAHSHGTYLFEVYMTAEINNKTVESNHIVKDIIWYDATSTVPVISCTQQNFTVRQYETININYTVYDPSTETPSISLKSTYVNEDGETIEEYNSNLIMSSNTDIWQYKTDVIGTHTLTITCKDTVKTLIATVVELGINVTPITAGLVFDFNPVGYSNNNEDRLWSSGDIAMAVSDNFDWVNGGYQYDENGDQYFCIKAGTSAEINYELFGDDAKSSGKQAKLIFKTKNVSNSETIFLSCVSDTIETDKIGIEMKAHEATIYAKTDSLPLPYAEEEIVEFEFNITSSSEIPSMVMGYEDGVSTRPLVYDDTHDFQQYQGYRKTITLGSDECDLCIYRFKVYNKSLSDKDILNNFIADARSAEEMIKRYERNQIYKEGILDPDYLAEVCPQLRIIKLEVPWFTNDKDDKVYNANRQSIVECIYKGGDPIYDNWVAYDIVHSGQGTSSNNYGPAGRNLDLILKSYKDYGNNPYIVLGDGSQVNKVSLTRESVPVNYFNVKVNIASSENANNALFQKRYNQYNPYKRPFVREDDSIIPYIKDTMEFQNCVIFVKESDPDLTTHREFNDNNWHFYAIGNIGDSKKTDSTRLTDPTDPYECILEVMDNTLPNSTMPTGKVDENGAPVYPIDPSEWVAGNTAYDSLYADKFDEKAANEKDNGLADTYGWRYIYEDGTDEENDAAKAYVEQKWKEFYGFVVTSTDEEFYAHLGDYCVLNSVLYYYLFVLRYTMTDNFAKNSFFHYGKTGEVDTDGNPIRKWDLAFAYDMDTSLGIDNYGRMSYRYGYEEIDYVDGTQDWVWNAPNHVFFLRIRKLFDLELCDLYTTLESSGCWSSTSLINQFNDWQMQFPEELWRVDINRKYIRTYTESYIGGKAYPEFLTERANGRKKTQRSQFERNQEKYMSSKFGGTVASADDIILRCSVPNTTLAVEPNFDIHLTPYSYVYLSVKYNTDVHPRKIRAVPNTEYTFDYSAELADIIEIYSASCIKSIGDLSACYLTNGTFANATKIRELILGNSTEGYNNTNVMTLGLGSNELLNKLDIQNMSGLTHSLDLSGLKNLEELYAFGSGTSGVIFADGGNIHTAEIPDVGTLQMKNLTYLTDEGFESASTYTLSRLVAEYSELDLVDLINNSPNLRQVRLVGIEWTLEDTSLLERLYDLAGVTNVGANTDQSVLSGKVYVHQIKEKLLEEYNTAWPDLEITYTSLINQFVATFQNYDGEILNVQYVTKGEMPVDPYTTGLIEEPTRKSTVSHDYEYSGWDLPFTAMFSNQTFTTTYTETLRNYQIQYASMGNPLGDPITAPYGTYVYYEGEAPTYTALETGYTYMLFSHWDKDGYIDGGEDFVDGVKTINAVYDSMTYTNGYYNNFELSNMNNMVELYALTTSLTKGASPVVDINSVVGLADSMSFTMGTDFEYEGIESQVLIENTMEFDGTNYYDTGISLFDEDKDFVLAIDYEFGSGNSTSSTLIQCYQNDGSDGFEVTYGTNPTITWGNESSLQCATGTNREMLILRHVKGETGLHVYISNLSNMESGYEELIRSEITTITNATLVFGTKKTLNGDYYLYQDKAIGKIHWAKVWMTDLGDSACKSLAMYIRENLTVQMCGTFDHNLSDVASTLCTMSFIGANTLYLKRRMNSSGTNIGGFAESELREWLEKRFYPSMPNQLKQLVKKVKVNYSVGGTSTECSTCNCHVYVPSVKQLSASTDLTFTSVPFAGEDNGNIGFMVTSNQRIRKDSSGNAVPYWTRSTSNHTTSSHSKYFYRVETDGNLASVTSANTEYGIVVEFSI